MPTKHEVRCLKCRRVLLNEVERQQLRCYGCRDDARPKVQGPGEQWEELLDKGRQAAGRLTRSQWELGDLAIQVLTGRQTEALEDYADRIGVGYKTLQSFRRTAIAFPSGLRHPDLSFSHHEAIANRTDRDQWLNDASDGHWALAKMMDSIEASEANLAPRGAETQIPPASEDLSETAQVGITNRDTAPVSAAQRVEDILERVPSDMMTPVSTPVAPEPHCVTCRCFEDTGSVQSSVAKVTV